MSSTKKEKRLNLRDAISNSLDALIGIFATAAGILMAAGVKDIPNLVLESVVSVTFSYVWVGFLLVGGLIYLTSLLFRHSNLSLYNNLQVIGAIGMGVASLVYGIGAAFNLGFVTAIVTLTVCIVAGGLLFKQCLLRNRAVAVKLELPESVNIKDGSV